MTLKDLLLGGSGGLFALLTILQISPIKINPWSALARSIGRALNKDVLDRLTTVEVEQKEIKSELAAQKALSDKREELKNISTATNEVIHAAQQTVLELQQTTVEGMKKAHEDGKLTKDEITELGKLLIDGAMAKMSDTSKNLLNAAGVDISAIIRGAGEALIARMK